MVERKLNLQMIMRKNVLKAGKEISTHEAMKRMVKMGSGSIVVTEREKPIGIFTERDLLKKVMSAGLDIRKTVLDEVMTREIVSCRGTDSVDEAYKKMQKGNFRHLLVVDGGKLEGIISIKDLAKIREKILEKRVDEKTREIVAVRDRLAHSLKMIEWEMSVAGAFQKKLILKKFPETKNIRIAHAYQQAESVGGDYFEVIRKTKDELAIFVTDVMGHSISSALIAIVMKMYFSGNYRRFKSPGELVTFINGELAELIPEAYFAAGFCGFLNTHTLSLRYTQFGLPFPGILRGKTGEYEHIPPDNTPIGIYDTMEYKEQQISLYPGDRLMLFTDGCTEQKNSANIMLGDDNFIQRFKNAAADGETAVAQSLYNYILEYAGDVKIADDISILLIEFKEK